MSADEFDPNIERLFARTPHMQDAPLFVADVQSRLESGSRVRSLALTLAGLVGGAVAVRESLNLNLNLSSEGAPVAGKAIGRGIETVSANAQGVVLNAMEQMGLANLSLGSMGGMQLFWLMAAALIALATAGVMKLSQEA